MYKIELIYSDDIVTDIEVEGEDIVITYNINNNGKFLTISFNNDEKKLYNLLKENLQPIKVNIYKDNILFRDFSNIFNFYYREEIALSEELLHFDIK